MTIQKRVGKRGATYRVAYQGHSQTVTQTRQDPARAQERE